MKHYKIAFSQTGLFAPLFLDYLAGHDAVRSLYAQPPTAEGFLSQIQSKSFSKSRRETLVAALQRQYQPIGSAPSAQIEALLDSRTFTVTTGHQLNIFSGPLYFILKIVSTINLAKKLQSQFPEYRFVPVYWMATEDHDFAEINHFSLFGKTWNWDFPEAAGPVGKLPTNGLANLLEEIKELPEFFKTAYSSGWDLATATRYYVHHLFGEQGLLIVDGDDPQLKAQFRHVVADDLRVHSAKKAVDQTNAYLEGQGYGKQVFVRDINLFYIEKGIRERIERDGEHWVVLNTDIRLSESEWMEMLEKNPERFSPNVILRPLYQELILPNIAYLGGPAEIAYWLQLKGVFDHFQLPFPILMPRNFAMIINQTSYKRMEKLGIGFDQLFLDEQTLKNWFVQKNTSANLELDSEIAALEKVFEAIVGKAVQVDRSLEGFIRAETQKTVKQLEGIRRRLKKAEESKMETEINQLFSLKSKLFPNGSPQERVDNFLNFYLNDTAFLTMLFKNLDPFDFQMHILAYS